jgi:hypothetical protein
VEDDRAGLGIFDYGAIYYLIRLEDLRDRKFNDVRVIVQHG